jgi:hypothetical protein
MSCNQTLFPESCKVLNPNWLPNLISGYSGLSHKSVSEAEDYRELEERYSVERMSGKEHLLPGYSVLYKFLMKWTVMDCLSYGRAHLIL